MGKFWTAVARFLAVVACIGFVVTEVLALGLVSIERRLFDSATYKRALSSRQVYARMPRIIAEQLTMPISFNPCAENPFQCENISLEFQDCARPVLGDGRYEVLSAGQEQPSQEELQRLQPCVDQFGAGSQPLEADQSEGPPAFMQSLTVADWETIISALLPPEELKPMAESVLDQIFAFIDGQQEVVAVPLTELKRRIAGRGGLDAILALIRAQPACTQEQFLQMQASLNGSEGETVLCRPAEEQLEALVPQIQAQLELMVADIPDQAILLTPDFGENSAQPGPLGSGPVGTFRMARLIMRLSPDLSLFFLLMISLFAVRTARGWLRWWGTPILLAGLITAGLAISSSAAFEEVWLALLADRIPSYLTLGLATLGHDLLQAVFNLLMAGIRNSGILLSLLGLGMWIGSFFIKAKGAVPAAVASGT